MHAPVVLQSRLVASVGAYVQRIALVISLRQSVGLFDAAQSIVQGCPSLVSCVPGEMA